MAFARYAIMRTFEMFVKLARAARELR